MALRSALPFKVTDMLLIHRETGLLLRHVTDDPETLPDSDLVSGMLTAIRDFVGDAFGQGSDEDEDLDAIQYGDERILIETSQHCYLAVVVDGVEPAGFRAAMREQVIEISQSYGETLRAYDGDASPLEAADERLRSLVAPEEPPMLNKVQKRVLVGATGLLLVCIVGACLAGRSVWQSTRVVPTLVAYLATETAASTATPIPTSTATHTATATSSPTPTATATSTAVPTPTATATSTAVPTATPAPTYTAVPTHTPTATPATSVGAVMTGSVYVRQGPGFEHDLLGLVLSRGQAIEVEAVYGEWVQARWKPQNGAEVVGWVPVSWVGTLTPVPEQIVTPTVVP
jgi:cytoskeletal protein RodZ